MKPSALSGQPSAWSGWRLPLLMLGIAGLGVVAGVVRAVVLDEAGRLHPWGSLISSVWLLLPVALVAALCLWVARRSPGAALGGGVAAALVAAVYSFELLHPKYNEDANIGLGVYLMFGWLFPLGPAVLAGGLAGFLEERQRGRPPSPAALEDTRPLPPLRPWLWPLLPPILVALASALLPLVVLWRWNGDRSPTLPEVLLSLGALTLGTLTPVLVPLLAVLLVLRARAGRDGVRRPRLSAFWGVCLGVSASLLLYALGLLFGLSLTALAPLPLLLALFVALPVAGYGAGRWLGTRFPKS